jgi:hypothetical protein
MELLLGFGVFAVAVGAMALGVILSGRKLSSSCGGLAIQGGELLGECSCARKEADICASDDGNELVKLAELGNPKRKDYFKAERESFRPQSDIGPLDV